MMRVGGTRPHRAPRTLTRCRELPWSPPSLDGVQAARLRVVARYRRAADLGRLRITVTVQTEVVAVPLIDVTYDGTVSDDSLRELGEILPVVVSEAVDCPEEPWIGTLSDGDIEIRFRSKGASDVGGLNCVIEVRTKAF